MWIKKKRYSIKYLLTQKSCVPGVLLGKGINFFCRVRVCGFPFILLFFCASFQRKIHHVRVAIENIVHTYVYLNLSWKITFPHMYRSTIPRRRDQQCWSAQVYCKVHTSTTSRFFITVILLYKIWQRESSNIEV